MPTTKPSLLMDTAEVSAGERLAFWRLEACRKAFVNRARAHRSITEGAFAAGFQNMARFSRVFRAHLGMAPSDCRRGALA